jgi:serpin B
VNYFINKIAFHSQNGVPVNKKLSPFACLPNSQDADFITSVGSQLFASGTPRVRIPYGDGQMGMLIVLPRLNADHTALSAELLADPGYWTKRFTHSHGKLALPKFRMESGLELVDTLSAMGMSLPFDRDKADFNAMAYISGGKQLFINRVLHKTLVDVSERGTEAAAVTMVGMDSGSAAPTGNFEMTADRPFLFAIQDLQSGILLFVGSVEAP